MLAGCAVGFWGGPAAPAAQVTVTDRHVVIRHAEAPRDQVSTRSGWCGDRRYATTFRYGEERWQRRLHSVRIGRREVAGAVRAAIAARIGPRDIVQTASFDLCGQRNDMARLRVTLVEDPGTASRLRFVDLWVSHDGRLVAGAIA
jgi:hypothetical protein